MTWKLVLVMIFLSSPGEPRTVISDELDEVQCREFGRLFMAESPKPDRKIVGFVCYQLEPPR
jgi:hypothetical protein